MTGRVLIYRLGSLGDTVVALPCFHLIRAAFPNCEVRVLTNAPVADHAPPLFSVIEGSGLVDGYFEYPVSLRDWRNAWRLSCLIRAWQPDTVVYLVRRLRKRQVLRDAAFLWACGIRKFIGLPLTRDMREACRRSDGMVEREAERLARCLAPLGTTDVRDPANWDLGLTEIERAAPRRMIADWTGTRNYVALCTGTKQAMNDWGASNWRTLAEGLMEAYPHKLVFVGGADDHVLSQEITGDWPGRCVNLCGILSVRDSAAVIAAASLFVGVDSGPMHLAGAVGTPLVGIFSKLNPPGLWFPFGEQIRVLYPYALEATIASITPAEVAAAAASLLPIDAMLGQQGSGS
ncbi:MAG: glycosyl transferase family 9 [Rhodospirillales bacterium]|nr:glycosyl transferase family 9 [Rhodospirillales bacterium]